MSSPVRKAKSRAGSKYPKRTYWSVNKGHWVRAPNNGKMTVNKNGVVRVLSGGKKQYRHLLYGVKARKGFHGKNVKDGQWIGVATSRKLVTYRRRKKLSSGKIIELGTKKVIARPVGGHKPTVKATLWMPGVRQVRAWGALDMRHGGGYTARKVTFHTTESGNDSGSIVWLPKYVIDRGSSYTVLWNPWTGQFRQMYAANVGARSLKGGRWGYETNRNGRINIQVSIVGRASQRPLAGGSPLKGRQRLIEWLDAWGIPHTDITSASRSKAAYNRSGYSSHASVPYNDHYDPGATGGFKLLWVP